MREIKMQRLSYLSLMTVCKIMSAHRSDVHIQSIQSNTDHSSRYIHTIAGTAVIETHWINCMGECSQRTSVSCIYRAAFARTCSDASACPGMSGRAQTSLDMSMLVRVCPQSFHFVIRTCPGMTCPGMSGHARAWRAQACSDRSMEMQQT